MTPFCIKDKQPEVGQRCLVFRKLYSWTFAYWLREGNKLRFEEWYQGKMTVIEGEYWMPEPLPPEGIE